MPCDGSKLFLKANLVYRYDKKCIVKKNLLNIYTNKKHTTTYGYPLGTANSSVCLLQSWDYLAEGERCSRSKQPSGCFEPKPWRWQGEASTLCIVTDPGDKIPTESAGLWESIQPHAQTRFGAATCPVLCRSGNQSQVE